MKCPLCAVVELGESVENHLYLESGLDNITLAGITVRKCPKCGVRMPVIPNIEGLHRAIAITLIKQPERLTPKEIVFLRKSMGWSGVDFARNMHCSSSQVSKWESGKVPMSKSNELLLRDAVAYGKKISDYRMHEAAVEDQARRRGLFLRLEEDSWKEAA
jgi:putative zinc finger/helix-turn-helix YgiT family protein